MSPNAVSGSSNDGQTTECKTTVSCRFSRDGCSARVGPSEYSSQRKDSDANESTQAGIDCRWRRCNAARGMRFESLVQSFVGTWEQSRHVVDITVALLKTCKYIAEERMRRFLEQELRGTSPSCYTDRQRPLMSAEHRDALVCDSMVASWVVGLPNEPVKLRYCRSWTIH